MDNALLRGSEWRKWDLHIHTPGTKLNDQYKCVTNDVWDEFVSHLENSSTVVFGITDYFSVDNYFKGKELLAKKYPQSKKILFPNIEFRLSMQVNKDHDEMHLHIIFDNTAETEDRLGKILAELKIELTDKNDVNISCSELKTNNDYEKACVNLNEIKRALKAVFGKDEPYLIIGVATGQGSLRAHGSRRKFHLSDEVDKECHLFFGSGVNREYFLKNDRYEDKTIKALPKPVISGSDAHSFEQMEAYETLTQSNQPSVDPTWIKADTTFEGLKQVLFEPRERVSISRTLTNVKNPSKVIRSISIKNSNKWFNEDEIPLNENMVAIVGEKGSGKTALADLLAYAGGDFNTNDKALSFIRRALRATPQIEKTIKGSCVVIKWANGTPTEVVVDGDFSNYLETRNVRYLSQSFIEEKCKPENEQALQNEIEDIIFQYIPIPERLSQTSFQDLKKKTTESVNIKKNSCKETIFRLNGEINQRRDAIAELPGKEKEKSDLENELNQSQAPQIPSVNKKEQKIDKYLKAITERIKTMEEDIAVLDEQRYSIDTITAELSSIEADVLGRLIKIKPIFDDIKLTYLFNKIKLDKPKNILQKLEEKKQLLSKEIKALQGDGEEINIKAKRDMDLLLKKFSIKIIKQAPLNLLKTYVSELESRSTIAEEQRDIQKRINDQINKKKSRLKELKQQIQNIKGKSNKELAQKIEERKKAYCDYFNMLLDEKKIMESLYARLKNLLQSDKEVTKKQIEFATKVELDIEKMNDNLNKVVDFSRKGPYYQKNQKLLERLKEFADNLMLCEVGLEDVYALVDTLYKSFQTDDDGGVFEIKEQLKAKLVQFENVIFDVTLFAVKYGIKFQGTDIRLLSPGKKGVVLLIMYLALDTESTKPLIIDQPEENLDNKSVYRNLVQYFREAKQRRQIIVITHNPNLVLNTDAEQIVVANFDAAPKGNTSRITYIAGALEDSFIKKIVKSEIYDKGIREHGLDVLEGGDEAFKKRSEKWGRSLQK